MEEDLCSFFSIQTGNTSPSYSKIKKEKDKQPAKPGVKHERHL